MTGVKLLGRAHVHEEWTLSGRTRQDGFQIDLRNGRVAEEYER